MYTNAGLSNVDSVCATEGSFRNIPMSAEGPIVTVKMMYLNKKTGSSWGEVNIRETLLSQKTMELFQEFLKSMEFDFGSILFKDQGNIDSTSSPQSTQIAESSTGLTTKFLGGL